MSVFIRIGSFSAAILAIGLVIYLVIGMLKMKEMHKINQEISIYLKTKDFLKMKNDGEDPCDVQTSFLLPRFSEDCDYVVKKGSTV